MRTYRSLTILVLFAIALVCALKAEVVLAQYTPADNVTLTMYRLDQLTGGIADPPTPCTKDEPAIAQSYGCTAVINDSNYAYPFVTSVITIGIESYLENSVQQGYLHNVVPHELDIAAGSQGNKPLAAVEAQAIAARSHLYERILHPEAYGPVNNSSKFAVYLPFRYDRLSAEQQQRVRDSLLRRLYMTESNTTYPIDAEYGADNAGATTEGTPQTVSGINYLRSVEDPISAAYGTADGTDRGGMSSKGASRWSFGHTSSRGPAGVGEDYCPSLAGFVPDNVGNGQCWSVRYDQAAQILTHYYTGVQVRDANNADANSNLVTPRYRWNPLALDLAYAGCLTSPPTVRLDMQNSGVDSWDLNNVRLFYSVLFLDGAQAAQDEALVELATEQITSAALAADPAVIIAQGSPTRSEFQLPADHFTHGAGRYRILFDVQINGQNFADLAAAETPAKSWPTLARVLTLSSCQTGSIYLPLVQGDATATTLSE